LESGENKIMNRVAPRNAVPGEELDALLGDFFKSEMPAPWPAFRPSVQQRILPERPDRPAGWSAFGSRLALAASVGLLVLGTWLLPASVNAPNGKQPDSIPTLDRGSATPGGFIPPGGQPGKLTPAKKPDKAPGNEPEENRLFNNLSPSAR